MKGKHKYSTKDYKKGGSMPKQSGKAAGEVLTGLVTTGKQKPMKKGKKGY